MYRSRVSSTKFSAKSINQEENEKMRIFVKFRQIYDTDFCDLHFVKIKWIWKKIHKSPVFEGVPKNSININFFFLYQKIYLSKKLFPYSKRRCQWEWKVLQNGRRKERPFINESFSCTARTDFCSETTAHGQTWHLGRLNIFFFAKEEKKMTIIITVIKWMPDLVSEL